MNRKGDAESSAAQLEAHPDFRVLRRLDATRQGPALAGPTVRRAAIVDTETTGTDHLADKVIELAVVVFEYCHATGTVGRVLGVYDGLEDPGVPIPASSTAIHGITDAMVAGQRIDDVSVANLLDGVGLVIAHNAAFDRKFLEPRLPVFASLAWACSWAGVPWSEAGIESSKLEYLAYRNGFFFEGHRAEIDCRALLEVLRRPFGDTGTSALKVLLESARAPSLRIWATGSAFETKDVLKARGYRWEGEKRVWYRDLAAADRDPELAWLKESVYGGKSANVEIEAFDARIRYSGRAGKTERVRV